MFEHESDEVNRLPLQRVLYICRENRFVIIVVVDEILISVVFVVVIVVGGGVGDSGGSQTDTGRRYAARLIGQCVLI